MVAEVLQLPDLPPKPGTDGQDVGSGTVAVHVVRGVVQHLQDVFTLLVQDAAQGERRALRDGVLLEHGDLHDLADDLFQVSANVRLHERDGFPHLLRKRFLIGPVTGLLRVRSDVLHHALLRLERHFRHIPLGLGEGGFLRKRLRIGNLAPRIGLAAAFRKPEFPPLPDGRVVGSEAGSGEPTQHVRV